jgi:transposase-like protein
MVPVADELPVAGIDYPATFRQLIAWFPDEPACAAFLERLRWRNGFSCPGCRGDANWRGRDGSFVCRACKRRTSVTAGTIFHRSRQPLMTWFAAIWYVTNLKNGVPALGLQKALGLGSYETAWSMLHKLRRAMVLPGRDPLSGLVEVGEIHLGGVERDVDGRHTDNKATIVIAVELSSPAGLGRVRMTPVLRVAQAQLLDFVGRSVAKGSVVRTDGRAIYSRLSALGYGHAVADPKGPGRRGHGSLPGVHRVASLVRRWLSGTLHYGISHDHLAYYLDEFTFRFDNRHAEHRGLLFYQLVGQALEVGPHPTSELVGGTADPFMW